MRFLLWLAAAAAEELHILSHIPEVVQVFWLPGGALSPSRLSSELDAADSDGPSSFVINTYAGHGFRFQAGSLSSEAVTHSGGQHDLVILSKSGDSLVADLLSAVDLQKFVQEMHSHCNERDGYTSCCYNFLKTKRGIPVAFADKYITAYSPHKLMPRVAARGNLEDDIESDGLDDDGYGGHLPPDEMLVINKMLVPVDLRWVHVAHDSDVPPQDNETTMITQVTSESYVRITARPGQSFVVSKQSPREQSRSSSVFRYPGELAVAIISAEAKGLAVASRDQDELKIALSEIAQNCGDSSKDEQSFTECFKQNAVSFPPALALWWFQLLWTSVSHWLHCVHLPDSVSIRQVDLELDDGTGKNRSVKAQIFREDPLVLGISGLATPQECQQLIDSQDLKEANLNMAFISGGSHSKSRRTLTKNLYPNMQAPQSILAKLQKRFFQAARGASGYELWPEGQEPVNWLHYKPGYEYRPHCDGGCGMDPVPSGMRVASSLLYCNVAEQGGSTIFTQDTTKFTPARGDFLFFAYKSDPDYMSMHAACPVLRGIKSTATQWYREGVSKDYTWEDVADLGLRRSSEL